MRVKNAVLVAALGLFLFASAIGVIYSKHQTRGLNKRLVELRERHDALNVKWNQLRLEHGAFVNHQRIETTALRNLRMQHPKEVQVWVRNQ